jgi:hypothetical protein
MTAEESLRKKSLIHTSLKGRGWRALNYRISRFNCLYEIIKTAVTYLTYQVLNPKG